MKEKKGQKNKEVRINVGTFLLHQVRFRSAHPQAVCELSGPWRQQGNQNAHGRDP